MGFDVGDPGIFYAVFLLLGDMKQDVEAIEIGVPVDDGLRLLALQCGQFVNGLKKLLPKPVFLFTESDLRDTTGWRWLFLAHDRIGVQHIAIYPGFVQGKGASTVADQTRGERL